MYQRLQYFGVYGIIRNDQRVLLVKKKGAPYDDLWDFPGGKIEFGEVPDTTLIREILEETGLEIKSYKFLKSDAVVVNYKEEGSNITLHHVGFLFEVMVHSTESVKSGEDDVVVDWVDISDVNVDAFTPFVQEYIMETTAVLKA